MTLPNSTWSIIWVKCRDVICGADATWIHLQIQWKNRTDRGSGGFHWISVEFSATWQLHFHWNPPEHAVFSMAENVFGVDDFWPMRVQCLLNVWQWCHPKVMNDFHVGTYYLFNLDRGLCDFSTGAASLQKTIAYLGISLHIWYKIKVLRERTKNKKCWVIQTC